MSWLAVALGGALGATIRYVVAGRLDRVVPWGILTVNVAGSFVLGVLVGATVAGDWRALLGTGLCGAATTYSAFAFDTAVLAEAGERLVATLYVVASLLGGVAAALAGIALGTVLAA